MQAVTHVDPFLGDIEVDIYHSISPPIPIILSNVYNHNYIYKPPRSSRNHLDHNNIIELCI